RVDNPRTNHAAGTGSTGGALTGRDPDCGPARAALPGLGSRQASAVVRARSGDLPAPARRRASVALAGRGGPQVSPRSHTPSHPRPEALLRFATRPHPGRPVPLDLARGPREPPPRPRPLGIRDERAPLTRLPGGGRPVPRAVGLPRTAVHPVQL